MRWPPAEILVAALLIIGISCSGGVDTPPSGYQGEVLARRYGISSTGDPVVILTVGWEPDLHSYEQDTRQYSVLSPEARLGVGDCVLVRPYGQEVRLSPCR